MIEDVLLRCVGTSRGELGGASLEDRLVDLDFDSLRFIQLVVQLEAALDVEFEDEKLNPRLFERLRDVLHYLNQLKMKSGS